MSNTSIVCDRLALADADDLVTVASEAKRRTGKRPSPATVWRWTHKGCRGVLLKAVHCFGAWHTTREAFSEFIRDQSAAAMAASVFSDDAPAERDEATAKKLRAAGVL